MVHVLDCKRLLLVKITFVELWPTPHNIPIPTYTHKIWTRTHKSVHNLETNDLSSSSTFLKRTQKKSFSFAHPLPVSLNCFSSKFGTPL